MAKARGKSSNESEGGVHQQKLPLIWDDSPTAEDDSAAQEDPSTPAPAPAADGPVDSEPEGRPEKPEGAPLSDETRPKTPAAEQPASGVAEDDGHAAVGAGDDAAGAGGARSAASEPDNRRGAPSRPAASEPSAAGPGADSNARKQAKAGVETRAQAAAAAVPDPDRGIDGAAFSAQKRGKGRRRSISSGKQHVPSPESAAAPADDGESVGDMLLAARADLGLTVDEVSTKTRVTRNIIENLECNALDSLPAGFYCEAHIERLCELYNVDSEPILERFRRDAEALRGHAPVLDHVKMASHESESGAMIRPMPEGGSGFGGEGRAVSVTGILVSVIIALFMLAALWALIALHVRNRDPDEAAPLEPVPGVAPAVELNEFIVPRQLDAYELPIPDKAGE